VDKALGANMTRDTIDRAISRGSGNSDSGNLGEITYEGYASSGIAVLIEAMTDNRNRTVAEVRHAFSKHGGNLGTDGSVAYLFEKKGFLIFSNDIEEDAIMDVALDSGAEDVITHSDGLIEVTVAWEAFAVVRQAFEHAGIAFIQADISMLPITCVPLDPSDAKQVSTLVEVLEDLDDVQNVYTNAEWPE